MSKRVVLNNLSPLEVAALEAFVATLQARLGDQLADVVLFGSKARGDDHPESDVDVLVLVDSTDLKMLDEVRGLPFDILLEHSIFLSVRAMTCQQFQGLADMDSLFYRNIRRDGVSLMTTQS